MYLYVFSTCPLFLSVLYSYNKSAMSYYLSYVKSATKIEENSTNADFYFLYFSQKQGEKSQDFVSSAHLTIPPTNYTQVCIEILCINSIEEFSQLIYEHLSLQFHLRTVSDEMMMHNKALFLASVAVKSWRSQWPAQEPSQFCCLLQLRGSLAELTSVMLMSLRGVFFDFT